MSQSYLTEEIASRLNGRLIGNPKLPIAAIKTLRTATTQDVAVYLPALGESQLNVTQAGCVILDDEQLAIKHSLPSAIIVPSPLQAIESIHQWMTASSPTKALATIATSAQIHPSTSLGLDVSIGEKTLIEANADIANNVEIGSAVKIGRNVTIAQGVSIADNVTIAPDSFIDEHVTIAEGCVIGARPYQYLKTKGVWQQGPVYGSVVLQSQVTVGANTVIERGVFADTLIAQGVKVGPLVQIAHDVVIGRHSAIISHSALGANARIGEHCIIGGGSLIASQVSMADDVVLTGGAVVSRSIKQPGIYSSAVNVKPHNRWRKNLARLHQLDNIVKRFRRFESKLKQREEGTV